MRLFALLLLCGLPALGAAQGLADVLRECLQAEIPVMEPEKGEQKRDVEALAGKAVRLAELCGEESGAERLAPEALAELSTLSAEHLAALRLDRQQWKELLASLDDLAGIQAGEEAAQGLGAALTGLEMESVGGPVEDNLTEVRMAARWARWMREYFSEDMPWTEWLGSIDGSDLQSIARWVQVFTVLLGIAFVAVLAIAIWRFSQRYRRFPAGPSRMVLVPGLAEVPLLSPERIRALSPGPQVLALMRLAVERLASEETPVRAAALTNTEYARAVAAQRKDLDLTAVARSADQVMFGAREPDAAALQACWAAVEPLLANS